MIRRRALLTALLTSCGGLVPNVLQPRAALAAPTSASAAPTSAAVGATRPLAVEEAIWTSYYDETRVWGYVDKHSVEPGETFDIMLSTGPRRAAIKGKIEIFRIGYYGERDRKLVAEFADVEVAEEEVQATAAALGAGWPQGVDQVETDEWESGYYTIDFIDAEDGHRDMNVAFIVVTNPTKVGDILVELSTNTYQAYNKWGGYSFYESAFVGDRAQMISFNRPTPPDFFEYEYYFVLWLERLAADRKLNVGYASNFDIHRDPDFAANYKLFVSGSHNEYWSKEEFDAIYRRIFEQGKNTLFLGANSAYWQVRYADADHAGHGPFRGRQLICYKSGDDPIRYRTSEDKASLLVTALFRDGARRPETMLAGLAYQSYFDNSADENPKYPYFVARTDLPFFKDTGYKNGDAIGDVVGYEWDNTDPDEDGKRLWDAKKSRIAPIDRASIKIVFTGSPVDLNGRSGKAEATYFVSNAGAKVFSTGTIRWAWGLGKSNFEQDRFKILNRNLLMHLLDIVI